MEKVQNTTRVRFSQDGPGVTYLPSSASSSASASSRPTTHLLAHLLAKPMPRRRADSAYEMDACTAASIGDVAWFAANRVATATKNCSGWTPLHYAAYLGHQTVCAHLLDEAKVHVEERNDRRQTALMMAAACGNLTVVRLLLERGAQASAADYERRQALHYAASCSQNTVVDLLLAAGADPNAQDAAGVSPLHEAAINGHELTFLSLLEKGGNVALKTQRGEDCDALACDNPKIAKLIEDRRGGGATLDQLLDEMDLSRYAEQFRNEKIDLKIFFDLGKKDLDDMRIAYGPKKRMLDVIERYRQTGIVGTDFAASPTVPEKNGSTILKEIGDINETNKKWAVLALEALTAGQHDRIRQLLTSLIDGTEQIAVKVLSA